ncbi:hypothetical protein [Caldinitratiruptor microaerophilus]|uniref:Type II secretion system protein GspF domain-containing protein n=1 Tax=Caldinitratiruptor microaerophilus TaxID=671077 RepID=A0AA35G7W4_9FIRM|nr:hypothetical protein [Caldinitratiruptor microaerophilus]BDG59763.1 hypothetical protein caldi_08530 [Caldinitratiruptor microaerophilus]
MIPILLFAAAVFAGTYLLLTPPQAFRAPTRVRSPRSTRPLLPGLVARPIPFLRAASALAAAALAAALYGLFFRSVLAALAAAPAGWMLAQLLTQTVLRLRERRVRAAWRVAIDLFPDFLEAAGSPLRALAQVADRAPDPVKSALHEALARHATGEPLGAALTAAAPGRDEVHLFARLVELTRYKFQDVGPAFRRLGRALHEQHVLEADRRAEVAGARLMALLLAAGPVVLLFEETAALPAVRDTLLGPGRLVVPISAALTSLSVFLLVRAGRSLA